MGPWVLLINHSAQRQDIQQGWRLLLPGIQIEGVDAEDK
jgi:hypothetical protein